MDGAARGLQGGRSPRGVGRPAARRRTGEVQQCPLAAVPAQDQEHRGTDPWLHLKGVSTGDFSEALAALLGPEAKGLSATTITRLKGVWQQEYEGWQKRSLAGKHYV